MLKLQGVMILLTQSLSCSSKPNLSTERGVHKLNMEGKIVGGEDTDIESFPNTVFLDFECSGDPSFAWVCSGSILNQRIVLSAAHCFKECKNKLGVIIVRAGHTIQEMATILRRVQSYREHELFEMHTAFCDIGLALLKYDLPFGKNVQRIWIGPSFSKRSKGYIAGWGIVNDQGDEVPGLKKVIQIIRPARFCLKYGNDMRWGMFCAGSGSKTWYPAQGDSGAGLILDNFQQIGIYSFYNKRRREAAVYTNVSTYYKWVLNILFIQILSCSATVKLNNKIVNKKMEGKVVGGLYTNIKNFPHSVFLDAECDSGSAWICGGSALNQRLVLTAAHCIESHDGKFANITVMAGHTHRDMAIVQRKVQSYKMHDSYSKSTMLCDIALVLLDKYLPFGKTIQRVWISPTFPRNATGAVAGWGAIHDGSEDSRTLKTTTQIVRSRSFCEEARVKIKWSMFCASSGSKKDYPAVGDSGTAFVLDNFQQIGIFSYFNSKRRDVSVYTNVSALYDWIQNASEILYCNK